MSQVELRSDWNNEFVKEILWILKETEEVIDDQLNPEKRKSSMVEKIRKKWSNSSAKESVVIKKEKLEQRKTSILEKISILVKKRLGYDIDYSNSVFNPSVSNHAGKTVFQGIKDLCKQLELPEPMSDYIHVVIFSMIALKYLSDLEYIYRVNRGTVYRDRGFKANKFSYLRFKLHRYILNFALMSFHPFMLRFNKLRTTMKSTIDMRFYYINLKIDDYIAETKRIWKRPSEDPKLLDPVDQDELKVFYDECRIYLQEHCFLWLENFQVDVSGELCPDEFEDEVEEVEKKPNLPEPVHHADTDSVEFVHPSAEPEAEKFLESTLPLVEETLRLDQPSLPKNMEVNPNQNQDEENIEPIAHPPLFANFAEAEVATLAWGILQDANTPVHQDLDAMSQTNSSRSIISDGHRLPSNSIEGASTSGSSDTTDTGSSNSNDPLNPLLARKRIRLM